MLAGCSNRLQQGKVPKELPLIRNTLARGLRASGPPRAALPGPAERKASGIPVAVLAGDHSAVGVWSRWHAPSAPAPLAASLPRQSGAEGFRYSRRRGLRPRGGGQYRLSFSGCRVGVPAAPATRASGACHLLSQSHGGAAVGRTKRGRTSFTCVCAAESVRRPGLARSSGDGRRSPSRQRSLFSDHSWAVEGSLGKTCMKGWTSTRSKTPFTV